MPPESFSFDFSTQAQKNPTEEGVNTSLVFSLSFSFFFGGGGAVASPRCALRAKRGRRKRKMRRRSLPNAPDGPKLSGDAPQARGEGRREGRGALGPLDRAFGHPARAPNERPLIGPSGCAAPRRPKWPEDVSPARPAKP